MRRRNRELLFTLLMALIIGACSGGVDTEEAGDQTTTTATGVAAEVLAVSEECLPGELCVTVTAEETTGTELRLMLYEAVDDEWPQAFRTLPTPSWVVSEYPAVPDSFPLRIRLNFTDNLFAISSEPLEGSRMGLAVVTGVDSIIVVESTDARGFSDRTLMYEPGTAMNFGDVDLALPAGDTCELNPYHPDCLTGSMFWEEHMLGEQDFVPGAIYMDVADLDGDGINDIVMVGEPHFEEPDLPLTVLKLGVYYLNGDFTVRETEIIDEWSEADPTLYSPWGVKVIEHGGEPMIIVGTNIPGLAPLEDGTATCSPIARTRAAGSGRGHGQSRSHRDQLQRHDRRDLRHRRRRRRGPGPERRPSVPRRSAAGWRTPAMVDDPWIPHLQDDGAGTDPDIRGTLGYKSADLNGDGYPEVVYNAMFDIPNTDPPRYRGEIWLGVNPGPADGTPRGR